METLVIEINDQKAYGKLRELEDQKMISIKNKTAQTGLSSLRGKIKTKMSSEDIDNQLNSLRNEWQKAI